MDHHTVSFCSEYQAFDFSQSCDAVISIINPECDTPLISPTINQRQRHLLLRCHDISAPCPNMSEPRQQHVEQIRDFTRAVIQANPEARILVHCSQGRSRSPAASLAVQAAATLIGPDEICARALRQSTYLTNPNKAIVRLTDEVFGFHGGLIEALCRYLPRWRP